MMTRPHFGLPYSGYDASKPPPLGFITEPHNAHQPRAMYRAGFQSFTPAQPRLMMDPLDPSTWQRPYVFTT
jgi:hypothetical protein